MGDPWRILLADYILFVSREYHAVVGFRSSKGNLLSRDALIHFSFDSNIPKLTTTLHATFCGKRNRNLVEFCPIVTEQSGQVSPAPWVGVAAIVAVKNALVLVIVHERSLPVRLASSGRGAASTNCGNG